MPKIFALLAAVIAALSFPARAAATTLIHLTASNITFYYDRFLVEADGNVRVTTSDGMTMTGDAFSMDLRLNRFVLAGHVHMVDSQGAQSGAALADFIEFNRIYFVPILRQDSSGNPAPDRWTFLNGDFAHPAKGREMPGDTFYMPDLSDRPFLHTKSAIIGSQSFVRFGPSQMDIASGLGLFIPEPSFYFNFSTNRHLAENSLAGANFDATWQFAGGANAISALHFRYDKVNKTYMSLEQHLASKKAYAVFSINPMTQVRKFWDLVLSDEPSPRFQVRSFSQLVTFQHWLQRPDEAGTFSVVRLTQALNKSSVQLSIQNVNSSLLPPLPPGEGYHGHGPVIDHPFQFNLFAQTFNHRVGHTPFYEHVAYGLGYAHDTYTSPGSYGLQQIQGTWYTSIWNHTLDAEAYVPSYALGNSYVETKNYYVNASIDKNRIWYSSPHYVDTTTTQASLSKMFDNHYSAFLNYYVQNEGDHYDGNLQSVEYKPFVPVVDGVSYPGYAAFTGVATFRTLSLGINYVNGGNFSVSLLARKHNDFPAPIPNFFNPPQLDNLGAEIQGQNYLGEPPYDIRADVRARLNPHMSIDVSRAYYFNFGKRGWSPEFVFQVMP